MNQEQRLFPHAENRRSRGNDRMIPDGMDADTGHHRQTKATVPSELRTTDDAVIGKLYGPRGDSFRVVKEARRRVPFGFSSETEE